MVTQFSFCIVARNLEEKIVWKSRHKLKDNTNTKLQEIHSKDMDSNHFAHNRDH